MKKVFFLLVIFLLSFNIVYSLSFEDANSNIFNNLKSSLNRFFGFETSSNIVRSVVIIDSRLYNLIKQDF